MSVTQHIELKSDLTELAKLADAADAFCDANQVPDPDRFAVQVALEEVATNIINHGYQDNHDHTFSIDLSTDAHGLTLVATDNAPAFDPLATPEVDTNAPIEDREIGGLGVHLLKNLMQESSYERRGDQNVLTLTRHLSSHA